MGWEGERASGASKRMKYWPALRGRLRPASLCAVDESRRGRRIARVRERGDRVHFQFWQRATDLPVGVCSAASACV